MSAEQETAPRSVAFAVQGLPAPQGSKRALPIKRAGRYTGRVALVESSKTKVADWRTDVKTVAVQIMRGGLPLSGPLVVSMTFTLPKPKSAPKRRRIWPDKRPDISKILRSTEDALSGVVWNDDSQVVLYTRLAKVYPGEGQDALLTPGVVITVRQIPEAVA